jgi:hypothetical protein
MQVITKLTVFTAFPAPLRICASHKETVRRIRPGGCRPKSYETDRHSSGQKRLLNR